MGSGSRLSSCRRVGETRSLALIATQMGHGGDQARQRVRSGSGSEPGAPITPFYGLREHIIPRPPQASPLSVGMSLCFVYAYDHMLAQHACDQVTTQTFLTASSLLSSANVLRDASSAVNACKCRSGFVWVRSLSTSRL